MNALQRDLKKLVPLMESLGAEKAEADPHRQHFHVQPAVGWLNDPNGLCKIGDTYHVFYQYGPFDVTGGVKHWGHVTSRDLMHWQRQTVMLYPDEPFDCHGVYSGSALVEDGTMYLYYTGNVKYPGAYDYIRQGRGHNVCLATSRDGIHPDSKQCLLYNKDYPAGLTCHVRDPKVFAYEGRYYMVLGARTVEDKGEVLVLESTDKLHWIHINTLTTPDPFGYMWECPDLFAIDGQWFLAVSPQGIECQNIYGCGYFPVYGDWRGTCTLGAFRHADFGFDYYAPQSFADGDRRIQIGWMGMPDADYTNPTDFGWQHCLTVPRQLTRAGDRLLQNPVSELAALHGAARDLPEKKNVTVPPCFDLLAAPAGNFTLTVADGMQLAYNEADGSCTLYFTNAAMAYGRTSRHVVLDAPCRRLRVVGDASSLEIFLNDGAAVLSTRYYPAPGAVSLHLEGCRGTLYELTL